MKSLVGFLLILSGLILAIPQLYEVLAYLDTDGWPIVQGILGVSSIVLGILSLLRQGRPQKKTLVEVG